MTERGSGWYDDPDDDSQLRYYDGIVWTDRRSPKHRPPRYGGREDVTPAPAQEQAPPQPERPSWPQAEPAAQNVEQGARPGRGAAVVTPDGQRVSGWWRRFGALVLDWILVSIVGTVIALPWMGSWIATYLDWVDTVAEATRAGRSTPEVPPSVLQLPTAWPVAVVLVYAVYEIGFTAWRGRTLGKMVTGTSVRPWGEARRPSLNEACVRFLVKGIGPILTAVPGVAAFGTMFQVVDGLWPLHDQRNQSIHDKVAGTVVVIGPPQGTPGAPEQQFTATHVDGGNPGSGPAA